MRSSQHSIIHIPGKPKELFAYIKKPVRCLIFRFAISVNLVLETDRVPSMKKFSFDYDHFSGLLGR